VRCSSSIYITFNTISTFFLYMVCELKSEYWLTHISHLALLHFWLILRHNSYSIHENHPCQLPPVTTSVISLNFPCQSVVSDFLASNQSLMEDSLTKILIICVQEPPCWGSSCSKIIIINTSLSIVPAKKHLSLHTPFKQQYSDRAQKPF
jgi:hypothetical protein